MRRGAVDLGLRRVPVLQRQAVAGIPFVADFAKVRQHLGTPYAFEFAARKPLELAHTAAQHGSQRTAVDFPELADRHLCRVQLQCRTHRRKEGRHSLLGTAHDQLQLVFQAVDGVDDVVVALQVEAVDRFGAENILYGSDFGRRVDVQKALTHSLDLDAPDGAD